MTTELFFKNDSLCVNYIDRGEGNVVVMLHGWGASGGLYSAILEPLCKKCRVIAPDFPGFGKTTEPKTPYTVEDYADFTFAFLSSLGINKASLVGHSHGGRVAIKLASDKKYSALSVDKCVLIDSAGLIREKSVGQKLKIKTFKLLRFLLDIGIVKKLYPDARSALSKKFGSADYAAASEVMRKSLVSVINEDMTNDISHVSVPTLLIWGENDTDTPLSHAKRMEELIADSGLVVIRGGSHFSFLDDPYTVNAAMNSFLC